MCLSCVSKPGGCDTGVRNPGCQQYPVKVSEPLGTLSVQSKTGGKFVVSN